MTDGLSSLGPAGSPVGQQPEGSGQLLPRGGQLVAQADRTPGGLPEREGLLVQAVEDGSPAAGAGLERGDLIIQAGESPARSPDDLYQAMDAAGAGGSITLKLVRGTEERTVSVSLRTKERGQA